MHNGTAVKGFNPGHQIPTNSIVFNPRGNLQPIKRPLFRHPLPRHKF